jgi:hypothetical protein
MYFIATPRRTQKAMGTNFAGGKAFVGQHDRFKIFPLNQMAPHRQTGSAIL